MASRFSRAGADLVLLAHFVFVAFAVFGGVLVYFDRTWAWLHVPAVLWSSIVNLVSWTCPLTPLEKSLRAQAGQAEYSGGFVQHYVGRMVYPLGMPRQMELIAGVSILVWNALVYALVFWLGKP
jgi:hypothetical protein